MTDAAPKRIWEFDRYINGVLMAEGVTIEKQTDLASAMKSAAIIAPRGPHGEVPVLIVREDASEHAALIREAEARGMERAANVDWQHGREVTDPAPDFLSDWQRGLVAGQQMMRDAIRAEAASIRAAKATP